MRSHFRLSLRKWLLVRIHLVLVNCTWNRIYLGVWLINPEVLHWRKLNSLVLANCSGKWDHLRVWLISPGVLHWRTLTSFCQQEMATHFILDEDGTLHTSVLSVLQFIWLEAIQVLSIWVHMCTRPVISLFLHLINVCSMLNNPILIFNTFP